MKFMLKNLVKKTITSFYRCIRSHCISSNDISNGSIAKIDKKAYLRNTSINGNVEVGEFTRICGGVRICGNVIIGRYTSINGPNSSIMAKHNPITIGNFCSIAHNVTIIEYNHDFRRLTSYFINKHLFYDEAWMHKDIYSKGAVFIGHDVWVGAGSVILSGTNIGNGAVIGANTVVNKDVPPFAIVIGNPMQIIKYRFDNKVIKELENIQWWNWPSEKIIKNRALFEGEFTLENLHSIPTFSSL